MLCDWETFMLEEWNLQSFYESMKDFSPILSKYEGVSHVSEGHDNYHALL